MADATGNEGADVNRRKPLNPTFGPRVIILIMKPNDIPEIASLTVAERIHFVEDLWDSISSDEESVTVRPDHVEELDRRWARHGQSRESLLTLEELQSKVANRRK